MTKKHLPILLSILMTMVASITTFSQSLNLSENEIKLELDHILFSGDARGHAHHHHHHTHLAEGSQLIEVDTKDQNLNLYFDFAEEIDDFTFESLQESLLPALEEYGLKQLKIYQAQQDGSYLDLDEVFARSAFIPELPDMSNDDPAKDIKGPSESELKNINPHFAQPNTSGSLSGKTVWISPGHGWLWNSGANNFLTQRGNTNDMVEDFGSIEHINQYFIQYLTNAGANVWSVRERDMNTNEVIIDDSDGAPTYTTTGAWSTSSSTGYNGTNYQYAFSSPTETASATYTPNIPKEGWYWISAYYRNGGNRSVDAQYKVNHAGGETIVSINQEVHGLTWVYLGQFYFDQGTAGNVTLINATTDPTASQAIIADAIRFGGGVGDQPDCANPGGPVSGRARFDESARQYSHFQGYSVCEGDPNIRPHYAEWELAKGTATEQANAVYVSLHSNAFNGSARGTVTYMYNGVATPNSQLLRNLLQDEIMADIHGCWDANWQDRGTNSANFAEVREVTTMPAALIELAFHDNVTDAQALKDPNFRHMAARSMYRAIVKFFNQRDGSPTTLVPEPPTHLQAVNSANGEITLNWEAPQADCFETDAPTGYTLYVSTHGYGFADGIPVSGTSHTLTGLNPNTTYYFQLSATNAGGESFPTPTVAARTPNACDEVPMLIVDGFDRLDRAGNVDQYESSALGTVERTFIERMNAYDYMVQHARGIASCGIPFDGASNDAVIAGNISLTNYEAVDWITGEESTVDRSLDATEQSLVQTFLNGGGNLIISGAEIGWDIGRSSSANAAVSFYNNYLKASYAGDDGGTYNFAGSGIFSGINGSFDDGTNCEYNSEFPDRLNPSGGSTVVLNYSGGTGDGAAVAYKGADFGVVNFGFPLETVTNPGVRDALFCAALDYLMIEAPIYIAACTDPAACNYDAMADCDDGSCILPDGCTNISACNYNPTALCDDGSCILPDGCTNPTACNYNASAVCDDGSCLLPDGCTNPLACNYDANAACDNGTCILPDGCTDPTACNYNPTAQCDNGSCILPDGCTAPTACNYDPTAQCDDGSCVLPDGCTNPTACNYAPTAQCDNGSCILPDGCTDPTACNYDPTAQCNDGSCILPDGCTDPTACNYNPNAVCDNGACILPDGCTNPTACNYAPSAQCDDGSCILPDGCTDPTACNYNPTAQCDNGSCELPDGCTDVNACNYDPNALCDDSSCVFPPDAGFTQLAATYCTSDPSVALVPNSLGGVFSGPGVSGTSFNPGAVGTLGVPINIQHITNSNGCMDTVIQQTVVNSCVDPGLTLSLRVNLEGAYDVTTGMMHTKLRQQNLIPLVHPYSLSPWNHPGVESVAAPSLFPSNAVDWILVEMRTGTPSLSGSPTTTLVESVVGILLSNGDVVATDGVSPLTFNQLGIGANYHILVRHRNHMDIISNTTVTGAANMVFDFISTNNALGTAQLKLIAGQYWMHAADYTIDGMIQNTDYNVWKDKPATLNVYKIEDGNMDGTVQATDYDIWHPNKAKMGPAEVALP